MTDAQILSIAAAWQPQFSGSLLSSSSEDFATARLVWNGMIDKQPALIARCMSARDVQCAIKLARSEGLRISVRGGGHGVAGMAVCQDGLMIDLSLMKAIHVDPDACEVTAQPGVVWGELDKAAEAYQLATTGGQVSHTGIAGLTLGGGLGHLLGKFGAVCDNLLSVEMVTAEGELVIANEQINPDLFWAVRGAGSNFGVVTSFRYRLHPLAGVLAGLLLYPRDRAEELLEFYRQYLPTTPDELTATFVFLNGPDGSPLVAILPVFAGSMEEGEKVLRPLRSFGPPLADLIQPMPYTEAQKMIDAAAPIGNRYYWKSNFVDDLSSELAHVLPVGADSMHSKLSMILLFEIKGAVRRVPKDAMAFDHRDHNFEMSIIAEWTDPTEDEPNIQWARDTWASAQPYVSNAVYANHMTADESEDRVRQAYGASKYARLAQLKAKFDPNNMFCQNHNILPEKP